MAYKPKLRTRFRTRRRAIATIKRIALHDQVILSSLAIVIGILAGTGAILFREAITLFQWGLLGFRGEFLASAVAAQPWWRVVLPPAVGGLAIGLFVWRFMPGGRPQGVAQVIESSALNGGQMSLRTGLKAALVSAASIGSGASVGREGPVVHLCATMGSHLARRLHLGRRLTRTLLGCGVAAGVAASFNAPIAGVFFSLEVVVGHYALSAFSPVVIAAVAGTIVSRMAYGDYPAFILQENHQIVSFWEFPAFALLGLTSAIVAIIFMRSVFLSEELFERSKVPRWLRPSLAGLVVGVIALWFPQVLGVGYEATDAALREIYGLEFLLGLLVLKTAATAICLGAGFGGGFFSPSLFLGAMLGGAFGIIAAGVFPDLASGHGAYTIIGMGAVAGAVLGAPISTILIVFELTGDYALTIALMVATALASIVTQQFYSQSVFLEQLERRGVSLRGGRERGLLRSGTVRSLMDGEYATIAPEASLSEVRERLATAPWGELFVVDGEGGLLGTIVFGDMSSVAFDKSHDDDWTAERVARKRPPVLQSRDHLERAVQVFASSGEPHIAVVDSRESMKLLGLLHEHQVMAAYHRAVVQARREERGED